MKTQTAGQVTITSVVYWTPTPWLRWIEKIIQVDEETVKTKKVLQQMWQNDLGKQEWRDIEIVKP